jgi:hypothetical protein
MMGYWLKTLKFGFARIPKTYRRFTTENILAAKAIQL